MGKIGREFFTTEDAAFEKFWKEHCEARWGRRGYHDREEARILARAAWNERAKYQSA